MPSFDRQSHRTGRIRSVWRAGTANPLVRVWSVAVVAMLWSPVALADPTELVCKGDSYVYVGDNWQKLDNMQVRIQLDLETGRLLQYALARNLEQFVLGKSDQFVHFDRSILFSQNRVINESIQINRMSGRILHLMVDEKNDQQQTVFVGKCGRGRRLF